MVLKDYSDYVVVVFGFLERIYHIQHIRQLKKDKPLKTFQFNDYKYHFNKDRTMRMKGWTPWKKWDWKKIIASLKDLLRSKKIGLIVYREPPPPIEIFEDIPDKWLCKHCEFESESEKGIKSHMKKSDHKILQPYEGRDYDIKTKSVKRLLSANEPIEPYHISKIHQPSGELRDSDDYFYRSKEKMLERRETLSDKYDPTEPTFPPLTHTITPRTFKAILDSPQHRRAYKSFRFGELSTVPRKQLVWIAVGMVIIVIVVYALWGQ